MLRDLNEFFGFGSVTTPGALVLLGVGYLAGTALHEYTVWLIGTITGWYAGHHD